MKRTWSYVLPMLLAALLMWQLTVGAEDNSAAEEAEADVAQGSRYAEAIDVMTKLFLVSGYDEATFDENQVITRAEFTGQVMIYYKGVQSEFNPDVANIFLDVGIDNQYANDINLAYQIGIVSGESDRKFNPGRAVSYNEAVKMVVTLLGYDVNAAYKGGYPTGYLRMASELGLLRGLDTNQEQMTWGAAIQLLYNAIDVEVQVQREFGEQSVYELGKPLAEEMLGFIKEEGTVNAIGFKRLGNVRVDADQILIGDKTLDIAFVKVPDLLGYNVDYYYKVDEDTERNTLLYIAANDQNENMLEISRRDLLSYKERLFSYSEPGSDKVIYEQIAPSTDVIYNYAPADGDYETLIGGVTNGVFRFIDANNDGTYEDLLIIEPKDYAIKYVNEDSEFIVPMFTNTNIAIPTASDDTYTRIINADGIEMNSIRGLGLEKWDMLSVIKSLDGTVTEVTICTGTVEGTITEMEQDGSTMTVTIEGTEYTVTPDCVSDMIGVNFTGTFYLNAQGEIAAVNTDMDGQTMQVGLITRASLTSSLDARLMLEILTQENQLVQYTLRKDITLDGEKCTEIGEKYAQYLAGDMSENGLWGQGVTIKRDLIRYRLNGEGLITEIDTPRTSPYESSYDALNVLNTGFTSQASSGGTEIKVADTGERVKYNKTLNKLTSDSKNDVFMNAETTVYFAPTDPSDWDERQYRVGTTTMFSNGKYYQIMAYNTTQHSKYATHVIYYKTGTTGAQLTSDTPPTIVSEVTKVVDGEDIVCKFTGFTWEKNKMVRVEALCVDENTLDNVASMGNTNDTYKVEPGDIIRYELNDFSRVDSIVMLYKYNQDSMVAGNPIGQGSNGVTMPAKKTEQFRLSRVYVYEKMDEFLTFSFEDPRNYESYDPDLLPADNELHKCTNTVIVLYDSKAGDARRVRQGSISDVNDYVNNGDQMSEVFFYSRYEEPRMIILYR